MQATELEKTENYYRTQMQKDRIVDRLKENGCRIIKTAHDFTGCDSEWKLHQLQRDLL